MHTNFKLSGEYIELFKLLKVTGLAESGGMAKYVISQGQVSVDGTIETRKRCKIQKGQKVEWTGNIIQVD